MADYPACRLATWADVDRWVDSLAGAIRDAGHVPETIVALTRGGWAPARLLADRFALKRLLALRTQHWGITATRDGHAELTEGLAGPLRGESVLIVDDITDTGESLSLAAEHVHELGPNRLETATCLHITHAKFVPTYHAETIDRDHWVWVVFPWTYWEDLRTLAARGFDESHSVAKTHRLLAERCGLKVPRNDVARAIREASPPKA
jgi:hypoxanthine phosphoribosyltransferase